MYAFTGFSSSQAVMIFGFKEIEEAARVLVSHNAVLLSAEEFKVIESEEDWKNGDEHE